MAMRDDCPNSKLMFVPSQTELAAEALVLVMVLAYTSVARNPLQFYASSQRCLWITCCILKKLLQFDHCFVPSLCHQVAGTL